MGFVAKARQLFSTDQNLQNGRRHSARAARALPRATGHYIVEKVPVVHWAPHYNPRWLLTDALAGITIGVMLIPQALAYAKIATIPGQYGLMSSWLPNFLYFFMGTSKGVYTELFHPTTQTTGTDPLCMFYAGSLHEKHQHKFADDAYRHIHRTHFAARSSHGGDCPRLHE